MAFAYFETIGKLYYSDLTILNKATASTKLVFSTLRSLSETAYAKSHDGKLHLSTSDIAHYNSHIYTARSVRRYLNNLTQGFPELYQEQYCHTKEKLTIKLKQPVWSKGFIFIMAPTIAELLKPSLILSVSMLLDKAAFNHRLKGTFGVNSSQLKEISQEVGVSVKSVILCIQHLSQHGLIVAKDFNYSTPNGMYSHGFDFIESVKQDYEEMISITTQPKSENTENDTQPVQRIYNLYMRLSSRDSTKTRKVRRSHCKNNSVLNKAANSLKEHLNKCASHKKDSNITSTLDIPDYALNETQSVSFSHDCINSTDIYGTDNICTNLSFEDGKVVIHANECASFIDFNIALNSDGAFNLQRQNKGGEHKRSKTHTLNMSLALNTEIKEHNIKTDTAVTKNSTTNHTADKVKKVNSTINKELLEGLQRFNELVNGGVQNNLQRYENNFNNNKTETKNKSLVSVSEALDAVINCSIKGKNKSFKDRVKKL